MEITKSGNALSKYKFPLFVVLLTMSMGIALSLWPENIALLFSSDTSIVHFDQEYSLQGAPLNPSTQSINRYNSRLRQLGRVTANFNPQRQRLVLTLNDGSIAESGETNQTQKSVVLADIEARFLVPLLPYAHPELGLDEFSRFNLMLSEYARIGITLSYQQSNQYFGSFYDGQTLFDASSAEYLYADGEFSPNPAVLPKRMGITNNCLTPGRWEITASDSVGEMYHGWFSFPIDIYLAMIRDINDFDLSDRQLKKILKYQGDLEVLLTLDHLRTPLNMLHQTEATIATNKAIAGYSSQDSRRKVQQGYFRVKREEKLINAEYFSDLESGDVFEMYKFVAPGVYSPKKSQIIAFDPNWSHVEIREVKPLTYYKGNHSEHDQFGYIELTLYSSDNKRAIIAGNIPISLLVFQEDYDIPAFGVGVLNSSEPIEQRYLRMQRGPSPHYAYMARHEKGKLYGINNHEYGLEQLYLRPFRRNGEIFLRLTLISYERIVDILELEIPLNEVVGSRIVEASKVYKSPLFRTYLDSNIL